MKKDLNKGITLIEVVIYVALFICIIGSATIATWNAETSNSRDQSSAELEIEGNFLLEKINWIINSTHTINPIVINSTIRTLEKNQRITIQSLILDHNVASSTAFENISVTLTLTLRTDTGNTISQNFSDIFYLKK
jgi:hypothetical protein